MVSLQCMHAPFQFLCRAIPVCGYYAAKHRDAGLLQCYWSCNCCCVIFYLLAVGKETLRRGFQIVLYFVVLSFNCFIIIAAVAVAATPKSATSCLRLLAACGCQPNGRPYFCLANRSILHRPYIRRATNQSRVPVRYAMPE